MIEIPASSSFMVSDESPATGMSSTSATFTAKVSLTDAPTASVAVTVTSELPFWSWAKERVKTPPAVLGGSNKAGLLVLTVNVRVSPLVAMSTSSNTPAG